MYAKYEAKQNKEFAQLCIITVRKGKQPAYEHIISTRNKVLINKEYKFWWFILFTGLGQLFLPLLSVIMLS